MLIVNENVNEWRVGGGMVPARGKRKEYTSSSASRTVSQGIADYPTILGFLGVCEERINTMAASRILIVLLVVALVVIETSGFSILPSSSAAPCTIILLGSLSPLENSNNNVDDTSAAAADVLFAKFDSDNNGYIDRDEFRAVAKTMKASSRRREILSVATATFGSIFVATGSNTFQTLQKTFRYQYMEENAEAAMNELFPTSVLSADIDNIVAKVLGKRGFTPENTLFGHSVCADEVNNRKEQLIPLMVNRWQEGEWVVKGLQRERERKVQMIILYK